MEVIKTYVSKGGLAELEILRVNADGLPDIQGSCPAQLLAHLPSDECGCPEDIWRIDGLIVLIHFEEDGSSDMFIFAGDDEFEFSIIGCKDMNSLRACMFEKLSQLKET